MKKVIRLTESDVHRLVKSSVNRVLREYMFDNPLNQTDIDGEPIDDEDEDFTPEVGYGGDIDDLDIGMNGADDNIYGFKSPFTGLRGYNGDDREFLDNATYEPDFNYYDNYDDIDMDDRGYENYIQTANESRNIIGRVLRESINNVLRKKINEGIKSVDPNNVVPEDLARKLGFNPEYSDRESGLEIWGKQVNPMSAKKYLDYLGISHFTTNNVNGNIRITVKPNPKQDFGRRPKKIGDYVTTEYGDESGEIFHNPKNGHIRRLNNRGEFK